MNQYNSSIVNYNAIATCNEEENHNMIFIDCARFSSNLNTNCNVFTTAYMRGAAC